MDTQKLKTMNELLLEYMYFLEDLRMLCVFLCDRLLPLLLNTDVNRFIPSIVLNCVLWSFRMLQPVYLVYRAF